jgi:ABC-type transport system involved in cytochrome c biogenesis permease subunit
MDPSTSLASALVALSVAAGAAGLLAWLRPASRNLSRVGDGLGLLCLLLALSTWIVRWTMAGHLPLFGTYESSLSLAVAVLLGGALARLRDYAAVGIWPVAGGAAALLVGHGLRYDSTLYALTISERSWIVDVHAFLAWAAFGGLLVNAGFALRRLVRRSDDDPRLDRLLAFSLSLGFLLHSGMLISGSFYKFLLFGRAWSFDPIETLGFVAWIAYGTLLHLHLFAGWEGRRLAGWCVGVFVLLLISYRGIVYFPAWSTYHIFDMDMRMHLTGSETIE